MRTRTTTDHLDRLTAEEPFFADQPISVPSSPESAPTPSGPVRSAPDDRPWTESPFWILQLIVLAVYLVRLAAVVAFHLDTTSVAVEFSTIALFLVPVLYAALNYGMSGAVATTAWVSVLAVPRFLSYASAHQYVAAWAELLQIVLLNALAFLIGQRVSAEREARRMAESAREAHLSAEALYRDLFDSNQAPILFVDSTGHVVEANAAAHRAFSPGDRQFRSTGPTAVGPVRLVDMIGAGAAAQVLTQLISNPSGQDEDAAGRRFSIGLVEPVAFEIEGQSVLYRPMVTKLGRADDDRRMQVVFEDVTAETRRHDQMEAYAARVMLGQEEERRHLAHELHDGPVQSLIHLCRQIDAISELTVDGSDGRSLSEIRHLVEETVGELRAIARGLRPSILDDLGLVASIRQMLAEAGGRQGFETSFGVTGDEQRLQPTAELALFRITQEALSNIERHAEPRRVAVGIDFESGGLRLLVKDDGVGFDATDAPSRTGSQSLGLPGMVERARLIGARLTIHSSAGAGTTVDVWAPTTSID